MMENLGYNVGIEIEKIATKEGFMSDRSRLFINSKLNYIIKYIAT